MKEKFRLVEAKIVDGKEDANGVIKQYGIIVVKTGITKVEVFVPVKKSAQLKQYLETNGTADIEITFELETRANQSGKNYFAVSATEFDIVG